MDITVRIIIYIRNNLFISNLFIYLFYIFKI